MNNKAINLAYNDKKFLEAVGLIEKMIYSLEEQQDSSLNATLCGYYFLAGNAHTELYKQYPVNAEAYAQLAQACYERVIALAAPRVVPEALFALAVLNHIQHEMTTELAFLQQAAVYTRAFFENHTLCEGYDLYGMCALSQYMEDYLIMVKDAVHFADVLSADDKEFYLLSVNMLLEANPSPFFYDELRRLRHKVRVSLSSEQSVANA